METAELKFSKWEARDALAAYIQDLKGKTPTAEDLTTMEIYRKLKMGRKVISLRDTFARAGCNRLGQPALAIARADAKRVVFIPDATNPNGTVLSCFACDDSALRNGLVYRRDRQPKSQRFFVPRHTWPGLADQRRVLRAIVPTIPPRYRPDRPQKYHILWEADWEAAPVDPLLLKRIAGDFFVVLAQWNLTTVERAVLNAAESW